MAGVSRSRRSSSSTESLCIGHVLVVRCRPPDGWMSGGCRSGLELLENYTLPPVNFTFKCHFHFRSALSTVDEVEVRVYEVIKAFESCESMVTSMCDLTGAFDCVPLDILLNICH
ncbi:hypothetical protein J6590_104557 [Homalodisca vitripennis]|nr:hypothetical protein J6590_104557 [Homalodisca vitripennis]